jgi:hypothetical protein
MPIFFVCLTEAAMKAKWWQGILAMLAVIVMSVAPVSAAVPTDAQILAVKEGGQKYLLDSFISDTATSGHWGGAGSDDHLADTAAAVAALLETGKYSTPAYKTVIDKGVQFILAQVQADGSINGGNDTYDTGLSLVALSLYGKVAVVDAAFDTVVLNAVNYLKNGQATDGGWGYGAGYSSGDISNTQFGVMGMYYGSNYLGLPISADTAGTWAAKLYGYLKLNQRATGNFKYTTYGSTISDATATGAGLWSLYMIGKEQSTEATKALAWYANYYATQATGSARWLNRPYSYHSPMQDYYFVYAMAKGLTGVLGSGNPLVIPAVLDDPATADVNEASPAVSFAWLDDLKEFVFTSAVEDVANSRYNWVDGFWLYNDGVSDLTTAWVLMSLTFADPNTASPEKRLPELVGSDIPVANQGTVKLETDGIVTISAPARGNVAAGSVDTGVELPVGSFNFRLSGVTTLTTVLRITPAAGSLDQTNPAGFLNADGTIKAGLAWFKLIGGAWKGLPSVPISLGPVGGPYTYIEITLTDNGPEDTNPAVGVIDDPGAPGVGFVAPAGGTSGSDAKCFIATAAFGSSMAPDVMVLRQFRDRYLKTNALGQMFVDAYYSVSPPIANFIAQHDTLRAATRAVLSPIIFTVKYPLGSLGILILAALGGVFWVRRRNALD